MGALYWACGEVRTQMLCERFRTVGDISRMRGVWDTLRAVFGRATADELALVGLIFFCVLAYGWAPKAGEWVGGLFDPGDE